MFTKPDFPVITCEELFNNVAFNSSVAHLLVASWTGGDYDHVDTDYHLNIGQDGTIYQTCDSFFEVKPHIHGDSEGTLGIAMDCCEGAQYSSSFKVPFNFGAYPPTELQVNTLGKVLATLCKALGFGIESAHLLTHWEYALKHHYGPLSDDPEPRFDLIALPHYDGLAKFDSPLGCVYMRKLVLHYLQRI